jgi:hypothetical protein
MLIGAVHGRGAQGERSSRTSRDYARIARQSNRRRGASRDAHAHRDQPHPDQLGLGADALAGRGHDVEAREPDGAPHRPDSRPAHPPLAPRGSARASSADLTSAVRTSSARSSTSDAWARSSRSTRLHPSAGSAPLRAASSSRVQRVVCQRMTRWGATRPRRICPAIASRDGASRRTRTASRPRERAQAVTSRRSHAYVRGTRRPLACAWRSPRPSPGRTADTDQVPGAAQTGAGAGTGPGRARSSPTSSPRD